MSSQSIEDLIDFFTTEKSYGKSGESVSVDLDVLKKGLSKIKKPSISLIKKLLIDPGINEVFEKKSEILNILSLKNLKQKEFSEVFESFSGAGILYFLNNLDNIPAAISKKELFKKYMQDVFFEDSHFSGEFSTILARNARKYPRIVRDALKSAA